MEPRVLCTSAHSSKQNTSANTRFSFFSWSRVSALPRRPAAYKAAALLTELTRLIGFILTEIFYYHKGYLQLFSIFNLDTDGYYKQYISGAIE